MATIRTDKIGSKSSSASHDVDVFLVHDEGIVKDTTGNEELTIKNSLKLGGKTIQEIYNHVDNEVNEQFNVQNDSRIRLITRSDAQAISNSFIVAVTKDEEIRVKGQNTYFLNGAGASNNGFITINNPHRISKIKEVVVANLSVYILYEDGELYVMGANTYGQLGIGNTAHQYQLAYSTSNVNKIATSSCGHHLDYIYAFILKTDNTVWSTGDNCAGQLGLGDIVTKNIWTLVPFLDEVGEIDNIYCCGTCNASSYILTKNGKLLSCGYNAGGALGFNDTTDISSFQIIPALENTKIIKFVCTAGFNSGNYTKSCMALSENKQLFAWGTNAFGQLGTNDTTQKNNPVLVNITLGVGETIEELYAPTGSYNFYIKTNKNNIYGAGNNDYGQLNKNNTINSNIFVKVFENVNFIHITSCLNYGYYIGLYIITNDNKLYVCGHNVSGVLSKNKVTNILTAEEVNFEYVDKIKSICSGGLSATSVFILIDNGKVFGCGNNGAGQIIMPVSTTTNRLTRIF